MKKNDFCSMFLIVVIFSMLLLPRAYSQSENEIKIEYLNEQLTEKQQKIDELYKDLDLYGDLLEKLTDKKGGQSSAAENLVDLKKEIELKNKQTDALRMEISELKKQKDANTREYSQKLEKIKKEKENNNIASQDKIEKLKDEMAVVVGEADTLKAKLNAKEEKIQQLKIDVSDQNKNSLEKDENVRVYENKIKILEDKIQKIEQEKLLLLSGSEDVNESIKQKDEIVAKLKKEISEKDERSAAFQNRIAFLEAAEHKANSEKEVLISTTDSLNKKIQEKDLLIEQLNEAVLKKDQQINDHANKISLLGEIEQKKESEKGVLIATTESLNAKIEKKDIEIGRMNKELREINLEQTKASKEASMMQAQILKTKDALAQAQMLLDKTAKELENERNAVKELEKKIEDQRQQNDILVQEKNRTEESFSQDNDKLSKQIKTLESIIKTKEQVNVDFNKEMIEIKALFEKSKEDKLKQEGKTREALERIDFLTKAYANKEKGFVEKRKMLEGQLLNLDEKNKELIEEKALDKQTIEGQKAEALRLENTINELEKKNKNITLQVKELELSENDLRSTIAEKDLNIDTLQKDLIKNKDQWQNDNKENEKQVLLLKKEIETNQMTISDKETQIEKLSKQLVENQRSLNEAQNEISRVQKQNEKTKRDLYEQEKKMKDELALKNEQIKVLTGSLKSIEADLEKTKQMLKESSQDNADLDNSFKRSKKAYEKEIADIEEALKKEKNNCEKLEDIVVQKNNIIEAKTETVNTVNAQNDRLQKDIYKRNKAIEKKEDIIVSLKKESEKSQNKFSTKEREYKAVIEGLQKDNAENKKEVVYAQKEAQKYKAALEAVLEGTYEDGTLKDQKILEISEELELVKKNLEKERRLSASKSGLLKDLEESLNSTAQQSTNIEDNMKAQISHLKQLVSQKDNSLDILAKENSTLVSKLKENEKGVSYKFAQLGEAMAKIQDQLQKEIDDYMVELELSDEGIEMTVLTDKLFNSGSAQINGEGEAILDDISSVLSETVSSNRVEILGHTDNSPIKYSDWNSNWELSTARALSVLGYFVDERGMKPSRFSVVGCGEYLPVAENTTKEGRKQNRRVDIVIKPL